MHCEEGQHIALGFPPKPARVLRGPEMRTLTAIAPGLRHLAAAADAYADRWQRAATFGLDRRSWDGELVLPRCELLHEAALIPEGTAGFKVRAGRAARLGALA